MAQRRMIDKDLVTSRSFMDMTTTAQLIYYRLCACADDEGFVGNPQLVKASTKTLAYLEHEGLVYCFKTGTVLIRHWHIHNRIRKDTFRSTVYTAEKALVRLGSDKIYEYISVTEPLQNRNGAVTQDSIGKVSTGKDSTAKNSIEKDSKGERSIEEVKKEQPVTTGACGASLSDKEQNFNIFWDSYPKKSYQETARITFMGINEDFNAIMEGLEHHKKSNQWVSDNGFFIPDAHNWLKKRGWENRPPLYKPKATAAPTGAAGGLGPEELAAIQRALREEAS